MREKDHKHLEGDDKNEESRGNGTSKECEANFANSPGASRHGGKHCHGSEKKQMS